MFISIRTGSCTLSPYSCVPQLHQFTLLPCQRLMAKSWILFLDEMPWVVSARGHPATVAMGQCSQQFKAEESPSLSGRYIWSTSIGGIHQVLQLPGKFFQGSLGTQADHMPQVMPQVMPTSSSDCSLCSDGTEDATGDAGEATGDVGGHTGGDSNAAHPSSGSKASGC